MPVQDAALCLIDGTIAFTGGATVTGDGIFTGRLPYHGVQIECYLPVDGTTLVLEFQGSNTSAVAGFATVFSKTVTVGAKTYLWNIPTFTYKWMRVYASTITAAWGYPEICLTLGEKEKLT